MIKRFGRKMAMIVLALALLFVLAAAALIGFVYYMETHLPPAGDSDVIIVLGAQVKEDGTPSVALERRLTAALEAYQAKPQLIIACGAQGANEPRAEGDVMRDWLMAHGVAGEDVVAETASFNTRENLEYARAIMEHRGLERALVVTSDYHVPRAPGAVQTGGHRSHGQGKPLQAGIFYKKSLSRGTQLD